jgi:gamma-glutamyltranspeptidase/glutathione hydrolase
MTGLLGGGHAIYWDSASSRAWNLDCFCSVPSGEGGDLVELQVPFGEELVHYAIGAASFAVPGVPAGLGALHERYGSLPWRELFAPALRLARSGVEMPPAQASCLAMLAPVMTMDAGARIYAPDGVLLQAGDALRQPGLEKALVLLADEGTASVYTGSIAQSLLSLMRQRDGAVNAHDLSTYEARWSEPTEVAYAETHVLTREGLSQLPELLGRLPPLASASATERVLKLLPLLEAPGPETHTTNVTVVDGDGNACVLTTSLGLGSGDWLPGLDLHLNSMLGESDLIREPLRPGDRMASMMAPTLAFAGGELELELALGAAGGTRLRTALIGVLGAVLHEGVEPQAAIDRPRFHPAGDVVNAEPGVDEDWLSALEQQGRTVRRWTGRHHYFGGVSAVGRRGAGADPRRSGAVRPSRPG